MKKTLIVVDMQKDFIDGALGTKEAVELVSYRLTCPGIGRECGASLGNNRLMYQGFFMAPHIVAQSIKAGIFCSAIFENLGFR